MALAAGLGEDAWGALGLDEIDGAAPLAGATFADGPESLASTENLDTETLSLIV